MTFTPEEIAAMAREIGMPVSDTFGPMVGACPVGDLLARFATLVADKAAARAMEAAAQVCDSECSDFRGVAEGPMTTDDGARGYQAMAAGAANCAAAIRARGQKGGV